MAYAVKTDVFEGPFDLLLHLVSRQKLDVGAISATEIADQYVAHIEGMKELDLEIASEFLLLASTLLEIKASALLPREEVLIGDELDDLSPDEMRDILAARLIAYKQFKNAAGELASRMENEGKMHPRQAGLEPQFLGLMPDYLEGLTLHTLATICAALEFKREVFLLEASHIAPQPVSVELYATRILDRVPLGGRATFTELIATDPRPEVIVVTFLALLELYKRGKVSIRQDGLYGEISIEHIEREPLEGSAEEAFDEYN